MTTFRRLVAVPALVAGLLAGATPALADGRLPLNSTGIPSRFADQRLAWHPCTLADLSLPPTDPTDITGMECSTFRAPRDWARPRAEPETTVAISRLRATGEATASLFTNPGGHGGPGRSMPTMLRGQTKLRQHQDVIGIDVRGTGKSENITCGGKTPFAADPYDRSPANLNRIVDSVADYARTCQQASGEFGKHVTTAQTIRDLDLLRVLLGRDKINYLGYSGGTWLGPQYAQQFPRRTGRFVVDSAVDFTADWQTFRDSQAASYERRWRQDFLPWLAKYDARYHFGATAEQALANHRELRAALTREPVVVDGEKFDQLALDGTVILAMYKKASFIPLAERLAQVKALAEGRAAAPAPAAARLAQAAAATPDAATATLWATLCNDTPWTGDRESVLRRSQENFDRGHTILGAYWLQSQTCVFWRRPHRPVPVLDGKGVPPVLVVQSEHDAATGWEGAARAHARFRNSRMITVTGEGDHGLYADGNAALDEVVDAFLVDGVVPADQEQPGMPLPVPGA